MHNRRAAIGTALLGSFINVGLVTNALAQQGHHDHAAPPSALASSAGRCVLAGENCLAHCIEAFASGDTSLVECARNVRELVAACHALETLAASRSKNLYLFAVAVRGVCNSCEQECRKHADHHAQCRDCAEACAACKKEIALLSP